MADANLLDLCLELQPLADQFLTQVNAAIAPSTCKISTTWRDPVAQQAAYDAGLSKAKTGQSPHECTLDGEPSSKAFDWSIFSPEGAYVTNGQDERYTTAGHIAEGLGLVWGGTFSTPDWDHAELVDWRNV